MLGIAPAAAAPRPQNQVRVITWNVFDLPERLFALQSAQRMAQVGASLAAAAALDGVDAVAFTELYVAADRTTVLAAMARAGLTHHAVLAPPTSLGWLRWHGVVVASRWPIEAQDSLAYRHACHGLDCFTGKGAIYLRLRRGTQLIHLVATHFYLGHSEADPAQRQLQALALADFIGRQGIAPQEPVILAGDLNAAWASDGPAILATLRAYPNPPGGALDHTFAGADHPLGGSPKQSLQARCQRAHRALPPLLQQSGKWIDYVVALAPGQRPARASQRALPIWGAPIPYGPACGEHCQIEALSDHYPVLGEFTFESYPTTGPSQ